MSLHDDILALDAAQYSQRSIAAQLGISKSTVQRHLTSDNDRNRIPGAFVQDMEGRRQFKTVQLANRVTGGDYGSGSYIGGVKGILPPPEFESSWRALDFSQRNIDRLRPNDLIELLANASPDISRAVWDTIQMVDPSHKILCWDVNSKRTKINKRSQKAADALTLSIEQHHGSEGALYAQLTANAFVGGAWFSELILDQDGRIPLNIVAADPMSVRFRAYDDPQEGESYEIGQFQNVKGKGQTWVSIKSPTVIYIPLQKMGSSPYGRPPVAPAIFPALFLLSVLYDLKRVVAQTGYLRYGIKILVDRVKEIEEIVDTDELKEALDLLVEEVQDAWKNQAPDDTYIYPDYVEPEQFEGAISSSSSTVGSADSLIGALERMLVRALKSMPIVMGAAEGVSEANANRQWEMYMAGIKSFQDDLAVMMERHYTTALNAQGLQADVEICFEQVRSSEAYRDAQARLINITAAEKAENLGYIDQDEGAESTYGHPAKVKREGLPQDANIEPTPGDQLPAGEATDGEPATDPGAKSDAAYKATVVILDQYGRPMDRQPLDFSR